jgi:hypothetical protein
MKKHGIVTALLVGLATASAANAERIQSTLTGYEGDASSVHGCQR